jgi:hypothetical protein
MSGRVDGHTVRAFQTAMLPAALVDDAFSSETWRSLREAAERVSFSRFDLAPRGKYEMSIAEAPSAAITEARELVASFAGGPVALAMHRFMRLRRGDYALVLDDAPRVARLAPGGFELIVDLSRAASSEAEVVFTHRGDAFFTMPQRPRSVALVARGPTVRRYARYLTHRLGEASVVRLELGFVRDG